MAHLELVEDPLASKEIYLPKYFHIFSNFISKVKKCQLELAATQAEICKTFALHCICAIAISLKPNPISLVARQHQSYARAWSSCQFGQQDPIPGEEDR